MSREIKFRAWNKLNRVMMLEVDGLDLVRKTVLSIDRYPWSVDVLDGWTRKGGYVLMQYTGLTDKNGNEIYEGDILHRKIRTFSTDPYRDEYAVVKFNEEEAGFATDKGRTSVYFYTTNIEPYMVVGNIYENPELLEGGEKK